MHPRCRSTISAVITEDTRVARNKGGRNIRIPADMNYADWKRVYIDRSLSLKDWQNQRERGKIIQSESGNLKFDIQRFSIYEDQIKSHGGSGNVKPDRIVIGHESNPRKSNPLEIIDHKPTPEGNVDKRAFYNSEGLIYLEIHTTNHNFPKTHPFGTKGEHAHDLKWVNEKASRPDKGRELTETERKDNRDIL